MNNFILYRQGQRSGLVGDYDLGVGNERGDMPLDSLKKAAW